jgi:hypothetical protein
MMNLASWGENKEDDLVAFEKQIGFLLPNDYRQFLLNNNGAEINNQTFFVKGLGQEVLMDVFYGITNSESRGLTIGYWLEELEDEIESGDLIIGRDPGGHKLLYITKGDDKGVYFWDTNHFFQQSKAGDGDTYFVADSFTQFCDSLRDFKLP